MDHALAFKRGVPSQNWGPGQQRRLEMVIQHLKLSHKCRQERALIDGCGTGQYLHKLAPFYRNVVGIDIEPRFLDSAKEHFPECYLIRSACEDLPLPDRSMDMIFSHEVLEHVEDDYKAVAEMARVIKPGGHIVLFVPNRWFPFETHGFFLDEQYYWGNIPFLNYMPRTWRDGFAPHVRTYDASSIWSLQRNLPLKVVYWTQIWPGFDALGNRNPRAAGVLKAARNLSEDTLLRSLGISHFLILQSLEAV